MHTMPTVKRTEQRDKTHKFSFPSVPSSSAFVGGTTYSDTLFYSSRSPGTTEQKHATLHTVDDLQFRPWMSAA